MEGLPVNQAPLRAASDAHHHLAWSITNRSLPLPIPEKEFVQAEREICRAQGRLPRSRSEDETTMDRIGEVQPGISTARSGDLFPVCRRRPVRPMGSLWTGQCVVGQSDDDDGFGSEGTSQFIGFFPLPGERCPSGAAFLIRTYIHTRLHCGALSRRFLVYGHSWATQPQSKT